MFIMRTTTNGMPRYNHNGEFNNSFHITRNGIQPEKLTKIIYEWNELLNKNKVKFICCSYESIKPSKEDFLYLDPPYANTKGMYYGNINLNRMYDWLRQLSCNYILSLDGKSGEVDNTTDVPKDIYTKHFYLISGNSSFKRTIGKSNNSIVYESLYIK
jgi:DNA adenine methylase